MNILDLMTSCRHPNAELIPIQQPTVPTLPPLVWRHCPDCGAIERQNVWQRPKLLAAPKA